MSNSEKNSNSQYRVLQVVDKCAMRGAAVHGVARLLMTWWPEFEDSQFPLTLCVLRGREGGLEGFQAIGAEIVDLDRGKFDPRTVADLVRVIKQRNIEVVHCHGYGACTFGRIAALLCRVPCIVHEHMIDDSVPLVQKVVDFVLAPATTKSIAVSAAVAEFMTEGRFVPRKSLSILYNTIPSEIASFQRRGEKGQLASDLGLPEESMTVGIVGRLDPVKGHSNFLRAAARVLESFPRAHFVVVGAGDLMADLQSLVADLGISEKVSFLGHREDIGYVVSEFDVYVSCSLAEGLGIANIEAMSLGVPVVATAVGGVPELITDDESGLLVPPESPDLLAAAVTRLLEDASLRRRLSAAALQKYKDNFEIRGITAQLGAHYAELVHA